MRRIFSLLALLIASSASPSGAQQIDGNELFEACTSDVVVIESFCVGYIVGAIENQSWGSMLTWRLLIEEEKPTDEVNALIGRAIRYCAPENASNQQLRDVVVGYLTANPQSRHETARYLLWLAMAEAFPCE